MAAAENPFLLDTGAWVAVRRRRFAERFALWGILIGAVVLTGIVLWVGFAVYSALADRSRSCHFSRRRRAPAARAGPAAGRAGAPSSVSSSS